MTLPSGWQGFIKLCREAKTSKQLDELFHFLLSPEEINTIGLRVELIQELLKGERTQREIASDLQISIAKITRGSNALKTIGDSLRRFLTKVLK